MADHPFLRNRRLSITLPRHLMSHLGRPEPLTHEEVLRIKERLAIAALRACEAVLQPGAGPLLPAARAGPVLGTGTVADEAPRPTTPAGSPPAPARGAVDQATPRTPSTPTTGTTGTTGGIPRRGSPTTDPDGRALPIRRTVHVAITPTNRETVQRAGRSLGPLWWVGRSQLRNLLRRTLSRPSWGDCPPPWCFVHQLVLRPRWHFPRTASLRSSSIDARGEKEQRACALCAGILLGLRSQSWSRSQKRPLVCRLCASDLLATELTEEAIQNHIQSLAVEPAEGEHTHAIESAPQSIGGGGVRTPQKRSRGVRVGDSHMNGEDGEFLQHPLVPKLQHLLRTWEVHGALVGRPQQAPPQHRSFAETVVVADLGTNADADANANVNADADAHADEPPGDRLSSACRAAHRLRLPLRCISGSATDPTAASDGAGSEGQMPGEEDWPVQLHEGWGAPAVLAVDEARIPGTKSLLFCCALRVSAGDEGQEDRVEGDAGGNRDLCRRWDGWIPVVLGVDASAAEQVLAVRTLLDTLQDALLSLGSAVPRAVLALDWAMVQRLKVRDRNSRDCVWCSADVDGRGRAQNGGPSISHASVVPCFEHGYAAVVRAVVVALLRSSTRAVGSLLPWLRTLRGVSAAMEYHPVHAGTGSGAESLAQSRVDGEQPAAGSLPPQSGVLMCRPSVRVSVNRNESRALAELLDSALGERPLSPALCSVPAAQRMRAAKVLRSLRRVVTALDRAGFSAPHATSDVERAGRHGGRLCRRLAALHHGTPSFRARSYTAELHNPLIHSVFAHVKRHVLTSGGNVNVASHRSFDGFVNRLARLYCSATNRGGGHSTSTSNAASQLARRWWKSVLDPVTEQRSEAALHLVVGRMVQAVVGKMRGEDRVASVFVAGVRCSVAVEGNRFCLKARDPLVSDAGARLLRRGQGHLARSAPSAGQSTADQPTPPRSLPVDHGPAARGLGVLPLLPTPSPAQQEHETPMAAASAQTSFSIPRHMPTRLVLTPSRLMRHANALRGDEQPTPKRRRGASDPVPSARPASSGQDSGE